VELGPFYKAPSKWCTIFHKNLLSPPINDYYSPSQRKNSCFLGEYFWENKYFPCFILMWGCFFFSSIKFELFTTCQIIYTFFLLSIILAEFQNNVNRLRRDILPSFDRRASSIALCSGRFLRFPKAAMAGFDSRRRLATL